MNNDKLTAQTKIMQDIPGHTTGWKPTWRLPANFTTDEQKHLEIDKKRMKRANAYLSYIERKIETLVRENRMREA